LSRYRLIGLSDSQLCDNTVWKALLGDFCEERRRRLRRGTIMGELFQPTHLLVVGLIVFVLFGAKRLPELGKGLGEGLKGFKDGIKNAGEPAQMAQQQHIAPAQPKADAVEQKQTPVA
jgi:sec-independent protein translocase protein TatA